MEIVTEKPAETAAAKGTPITVSDQPATPSTGPDKTEGKADASASRIAAAKAKIAAGKTTPAAAPATTPAATGTPAAQAGELTDEVIAAAGDKAAELAATRAAIVDKEDDLGTKAAKAAELAKAGDTLGALKVLGISLDDAVRKATGSPETTTREDELAAENKRLKEENEATKREADRRTAEISAQAAAQATTAAIIADPAFPNLTTAEHVTKALEPAKAAHKALVADLGRPLNETEKDRLVKLYLKKYNDREMASEQTPKPASPDKTPALKAGAVVPARPEKRTIAQVKADILAGKRNRNHN